MKSGTVAAMNIVCTGIWTFSSTVQFLEGHRILGAIFAAVNVAYAGRSAKSLVDYADDLARERYADFRAQESETLDENSNQEQS